MNKLTTTLFCASIYLTQSLYAGSIRISPVQLDLVDDTKSSSLTILNQATSSSNLQIRVFKWQQKPNGEDQLTETNDIAISPPALKMAASNSYNIRVVKTQNIDNTVEQAYRIIIDELPTPNDSRKVETGLQVLVRSSIPLFVVNKNAVANLSAKIIQQDQENYVEVKNTGTRHELIQNLSVKDLTTQQEIQIPINTINGYLLAGTTKRFSFKNTQANSKYQITLKSSNKSLTF